MEWSEDPGRALISEKQWSEITEFLDLSTREVEVSRLLFEGLTRTDIAIELSVSPRTVRYHLEQLHEKLHVKTRVGLVLRFVQVRDRINSE